MKISTCIITYNAEETIKNCLESVKWTDEIIIIDSFSTDKTIDIVKNYTDKIIKKEFVDFVSQKNYAISFASNNWVLCLDADEILTPELKEEIEKELTTNNLKYSGYYLRRHTYYLGKLINHCGWYPDYILRLFQKGKGKWDRSKTHPEVIVNGKVKYLKNDILHFPYRDISHHLHKLNTYSDTMAKEMYEQGRKSNIFIIFLHTIFRFIKMYFIRMGFLDGYRGLLISIIESFYVFLKYTKLYELHKGVKKY